MITNTLPPAGEVEDNVNAQNYYFRKEVLRMPEGLGS